MRFGNRGAAASLLCMGIGLTVTGCSEPSDSCTLPSDCPDGFVCSDGRCLPVLKGDASGLDQERPYEAAAPDAFVWPDAGPVDGGCTGNQNGKIEREELVVVVPTSVAYTFGTGITVDLAGTQSGGKTVWDLTAAAADDATEPMNIAPVPAWAAGNFPGATYVSLMNRGMDTYGVYRDTATRVELLGAISGQQKYGSVDYATPVELLRFPVQPQDSYSTQTFGTGYWGMAFINNWETYDVEVLGNGTVELPKLALDAVLVQIKVTQYLYGNPFLKSTWTLFLFLSECYGTVARVVVDGQVDDLTSVTAQERWRLTTP